MSTTVTIAAETAGAAAAAVAGNALTTADTPTMATYTTAETRGRPGAMGIGEGVKLLEQLVKQRESAQEQTRQDLTEMLRVPLQGHLPVGNVGFPRGGGLPVKGYRLPGSYAILQANSAETSEETQKRRERASMGSVVSRFQRKT